MFRLLSTAGAQEAFLLNLHPPECLNLPTEQSHGLEDSLVVERGLLIRRLSRHVRDR
jgi:hypothetical protein